MTLSMIEKIPCCDKVECFKNTCFTHNSTYSAEETLKILKLMEDHACRENKFECCYDVKLFLESIPAELLRSKTGIRYKYVLTDSDNNQFNVLLNEVNAAEKYIELRKYPHIDISSIKAGTIELVCVLDYDKLPDIDKLEAVGYDTFPTFHESYISVIEKKDDYLHLRFSGGFHSLITDIKMDGIFKEENLMQGNVNPFEYFSQGHGLDEVEFRTIDGCFAVNLSGSYITERPIGRFEGINQDELTEEELDELHKSSDNWERTEFINDHTIHCTNISFDFEKLPETNWNDEIETP